MRFVVEPQMKLGADIDEIEFDLRSRDEIPKLLIGLHHIYTTPEIREKVFEILKDIVPVGVDPANGRPGMELWKILVLGTLRLNCNWDYDKLQEIANHHDTVRQMLGHGVEDDAEKYALQTLKDNVSLFTPEVLDKINKVVVKEGHKVVGQKEGEDLEARCDSFVFETDVHYPTDINLLFDAIRVTIELIAMICVRFKIAGWRQNKYLIRKIKRLFRKAQNMKRSNSKYEAKKEEREKLIKRAHKEYIEFVQLILERVHEYIKLLYGKGLESDKKLMKIENFINHAERQIDQIKRRVLNGETIPHNEKVFSIFEEHTEWICKGKAGISQELGLRVCILEDKYGFILHHLVMEKQTDDKVPVLIIEEAQKDFPDLNSCSFDKGFWSPMNKKRLEELLDNLILPKKGKLSLTEKEIETSEDFVTRKQKHSAVESAINALENHSLDRCPDHGIDGFKRYVALAVLARNIQILGHKIQQNKLQHQIRESERYRLAS